MLVAKLKSSLGKSSHGGQTLYDHVITCTQICRAVLTNDRFTPTSYPVRKRDQLIFAAFVHDLGKLDQDFQAMLEASRTAQPLPSKRVKHEASTLEFEPLLRDNIAEVCEHLADAIGYRFTEEIDIEDTLAFAVTHHGLFYLSLEERSDQKLYRVRREWTVFNYGELRRITLTDLLFEYHPLGGLVIIGDLLGSFGYEKGLNNVHDLMQRAGSLRELVDLMLGLHIVDAIDGSMQKDDPRLYGLRDLLTLLQGGLE